MNKLSDNFELNRYGLRVRLVRETDAEFIVQLRTNNKLSRFINKTDVDIEKQKEWIELYKKREAEGLEYYFIFSIDGERMGVYRLYNITDNSFSSGSWVFSPFAPKNTSILAHLITNEIAWSLFPKSTQYFETKKENISVVRYNMMLAEVIKDDEYAYYFKNTKTLFEKKSKRIYRMMQLSV